MKKLIISSIMLLTLISCIYSVSAMGAGFSPSYFSFTMNHNTTNCQKFYLWGDSMNKITLDNKWNDNSNWIYNQFNRNSSYEKILVNSSYTTSNYLNTVKVCFTPQKSGLYHGIILATGSQQGNSIIQVGIWVLINVK